MAFRDVEISSDHILVLSKIASTEDGEKIKN
jgi:hypothetical protein